MQVRDLDGSAPAAPPAALSSSPKPSSGYDAVNSFITEARSIQALLRDYQARSEALKSDLSGFVRREIDEQAQLSHLRASVNQAELSSLRDSRYFEYATRQKGQLTTDALSDNSAVRALYDAGGASRDQNPESCCTATARNGGVWWVKRLRKGDSAWLQGWLPDASVSLSCEAIVAQVWLGWKSTSTASTEAFLCMTNHVYSGSATGCLCSAKKLACFGNGLLCTLPAEEDVNILACLTEEAASMVFGAGSGRSEFEHDGTCRKSLTGGIAGVASAYNSALYDAVAMSRDQFTKYMWPEASLRLHRGARGSLIADGLRLGGDDWDTLAFVDPKRLQRTVNIRGFFFHGELGLVEQLGVEVDLSALLAPENQEVLANGDYRARVRAGILHTLRALYAALSNHTCEHGGEAPPVSASNLALTIAIRLPLEAGTLFNGVLLDVRPITPQLPFEGRTTWMEVCAVGRQRMGARMDIAGNESLKAQSEPAEGSTEDVVFRLTYLSVASLQPYDTVSRHVFPLLNEKMISCMSATGQAKNAEEKKTGKIDVSLVAVASLCVGALSCMSLIFGAVRWARQ